MEHGLQSPAARPVVLVLMGVSGCGKTSVAEELSERLGRPYQEGDDLHPRSNVEEMAAGHPLTDEDRWPWLDKVAAWIEARLCKGEDGIVTCSALKRVYRQRLDRKGSGVVFVYLHGDLDTIAARITARQGHYMPPSLLQSQFDTLEEPTPDEPAIRVDVTGTPEQTADRIIEELGFGTLTEGVSQ